MNTLTLILLISILVPTKRRRERIVDRQSKWMGPPMAFTKDELQSLNTIMDEKLAAQRVALEQVFDQRTQAIRDNIEQKLAANQQQILQAVTQNMQEQQELLVTAVQQELAQYSTQAMQTVEQHQQYYEESVSHSLAAQLLAIEQLVYQRSNRSEEANTAYNAPVHTAIPDFDAIEVQTEIFWDELVEMIDQRLDERLTTLSTSMLSALKDVERCLVSQLQLFREALKQERHLDQDDYSEIEVGNMQDVFHSIEQLEHLVEAMQFAMTANSTLLSKRLYHHQQQPLERAHPTRQTMNNPEIAQPQQQQPMQRESIVHHITEEHTQ
jgi:hypothetical protein